MLFAGTYDGYIFQIVRSSKKIRAAVFSSNVGSSLTVNTISRDFAKYVVATGEIDEGLRVQAYAGDLSILSVFLGIIADSKLFECVREQRKFIGIDMVKGHEVNTQVFNPAVSDCRHFLKMQYTKVSKMTEFRNMMKNSEDFYDMQRGLLRSKLRSLSDLIKIGKDLSWYIDSNGNVKKDYRLVTTPDEFEWLLNELENSENVYISVDTEYSNRDIYWKQAKPTRLFGMSLSWREDQGVYVVFESTKMEHLNVDEYLPRLISLLNREDKKTISHNAAAEIKSCWNCGYLLHIDYDTLLIEFNIDLDHRDGARDLKYLSRLYFSSETVELEDIFDGPVIAELIPDFDPDVIKVYACADADFARKLFFRQKQEINVDKPTCKLDYRMREMLSIAEYYGAKIDVTLLKKLREYNKKDMEKLEYIAQRYIREVGMRIQAGMRLPENERTENNIEMLLHDQKFIEEMDELFSKDRKDKKKPRQPLTLITPDDRKILYSILMYPIVSVSKKTGLAQANADVLKTLLTYSASGQVSFLKSDVMSSIAGTEDGVGLSKQDLVLLDKEQFDSYRYPFAYILTQYRKKLKRETAFFAKLEEENTGGWYYSTNSMHSARTARVTNPIQTLEGDLKKLVTVFSDDYYYVVFDFAQIEYRLMIGLANTIWMRAVNRLLSSDSDKDRKNGMILKSKGLNDLIERMNVAYTDYHREGGSLIIKTTPAKMTSEERHRVKAVHFAVPFGAEEWTVARDRLRSARTDEERAEILKDASRLLASWRNNLYVVYRFLEDVRDKALVALPDNELPWKLRGRVLGKAENFLGRVRYFNLTPRMARADEIEEYMEIHGVGQDTAVAVLNNKIRDALIGSIRRESGNFPIQSGAREIAFFAITKLYEVLKREGLVAKERDHFKVLPSIFVHDECGLQVHRSIHPYKIYSLLCDNCMLEISGHPKYYMGVAIADNWQDGKSDKLEASYYFVAECARKYKENPAKYDEEAQRISNVKQYILSGMTNYFRESFVSEFGSYLRANGFDVKTAIESFPLYYFIQRLKYYAVKLDPNGDDSLYEMIRFCFADKCTDDSIIIDGKTSSQLREEYWDVVSDNRVNEQDWVTDEKVVLDDSDTVLSVPKNEQEVSPVSLDDDSASGPISSQYLEELALDLDLGTDFDKGILDNVAHVLSECDSDLNFDLDSIIFSSDESSDIELLGDRSKAMLSEQDEDREDKYIQMCEEAVCFDENELTESILKSYFMQAHVEVSGTRQWDETLNGYRQRAVLMGNDLIIMADHVTDVALIQAMNYLGEFKGDFGYELHVFRGRKKQRIGKSRVNPQISFEKLNSILNRK